MAVVVVSVPHDGPTGKVGRACAAAMGLAVKDADSPFELDVRDAGAGPFGEHVEDNARRAASDDDVVAYLGEFHSAATEVSLPILEAAGVPHISFSNTLRRLTGRCFVNVMPNDERQTAGLVAWMAELGVERPFLLDDGEDYGIDMRWLVHRALASRGCRVVGAERLFECDEVTDAVAGADGVFLGTYAKPAALEVLRRVHDLAPRAKLFATDGLLTDDVAKEAPEGLMTSAPPASWEDFAREAMALLLDAYAEAGPDRDALCAHLRATVDRDAPFGRYGFDEYGHSTLGAIGRHRVEDGRFVDVS